MLLSEYVKTIRKSQGLSSRQYADKIGLSHAQVSKIENGELDSASILVAERLCKVFGLHPYELCSMLKDKDQDFKKELELKLTTCNFQYMCEKNISDFCSKYNVSSFEEDIYDEDEGRFVDTVYNDQGKEYDNRLFTLGQYRFVNTTNPDSLQYNALAELVTYELNIFDPDTGTKTIGDGLFEEIAIYFLPTRRKDLCKTSRDFYRDFTDRFVNIIRSDYDGPNISVFITPSKNLFDEISKAYGNLDICFKKSKYRNKEIYLVYSEHKSVYSDEDLAILTPYTD